MNYGVKAGRRSGTVTVPASKSVAHRLLICAALSEERSTLVCDGISKDIQATVNCLNALGADIRPLTDAVEITPVQKAGETVRHLYCGESGSTLRFILPIVGALGLSAVFHMEGLLSKRPLDALVEALTAHGVEISRQGDMLSCVGRLQAGDYRIPGNISSQYISGLLFALPLLDGESTLSVEGEIESADYIAMTENALQYAGIVFEKQGAKYRIPGCQAYRVPCRAEVERDWSNAAFFLCMGALSDKGIAVNGMSLGSAQGDKEILEILRRFGAEVTVSEKGIRVCKGKLTGTTVDATAIPDLVPTISALASGAEGVTEIVNASRLRYKESDRLKTTAQMLNALGADVKETADGLVIKGKSKLSGGTVDAANDHRIAMSAAVAAGICEKDVTVVGAECVAKSYPDFWKDYETLEVYR